LIGDALTDYWSFYCQVNSILQDAISNVSQPNVLQKVNNLAAHSVCLHLLRKLKRKEKKQFSSLQACGALEQSGSHMYVSVSPNMHQDSRSGWQEYWAYISFLFAEPGLSKELIPQKKVF
jgi:hypothetical protein